MLSEAHSSQLKTAVSGYWGPFNAMQVIGLRGKREKKKLSQGYQNFSGECSKIAKPVCLSRMYLTKDRTNLASNRKPNKASLSRHGLVIKLSEIHLTQLRLSFLGLLTALTVTYFNSFLCTTF